MASHLYLFSHIHTATRELSTTRMIFMVMTTMSWWGNANFITMTSYGCRYCVAAVARPGGYRCTRSLECCWSRYTGERSSHRWGYRHGTDCLQSTPAKAVYEPGTCLQPVYHSLQSVYTSVCQSTSESVSLPQFLQPVYPSVYSQSTSVSTASLPQCLQPVYPCVYSQSTPVSSPPHFAPDV